MKVISESDNDHARVKLEIDESAGVLDVAREKFESALQDLLFRDEVSDSDSEEQQQQQQQQQQAQDAAQAVSHQQLSAASGVAPSSSRPPRKRRRKDADSTQSSSGTAQQSHFVVRMFDRSVDLAQFSSDSPLYPICRAWLLNEPHHASGGSEQHLSPPSPTLSPASNLPEIHFLPTPVPWNREEHDVQASPLLPRPITPPPLVRSEGAVGPVSGEELLNHHVKHWRSVRQSWKKRASLADARYEQSAIILKEMFRTHAAAVQAAENANTQQQQQQQHQQQHQHHHQNLTQS